MAVRRAVKKAAGRTAVKGVRRSAAAGLTAAERARLNDFIMNVEGGGYLASDPRGGSTFGVSGETLAMANRDGVTAHSDIRTLPRSEAAKIYSRYYLPRSRGLKTTYPLALAIYDAEINQGRRGMAKAMQSALSNLGYGVTVDGGWGKQTQAAFDRARAERGDRTLALALLDAREGMYRGLTSPASKRNLGGWLNRLERVRKEAGLTGLRPEADSQKVRLNYPLATEVPEGGMSFRDMMNASGWNSPGEPSLRPRDQGDLFGELLAEQRVKPQKPAASESPLDAMLAASRQRRRALEARRS